VPISCRSNKTFKAQCPAGSVGGESLLLSNSV